MRGQTIFIGFLVFLLCSGASAIDAKAAQAPTQRIKITREFSILPTARKPSYPADYWSSRVEVQPNGPLRRLSDTRLQPKINPSDTTGPAPVTWGQATIGGACSYREVPGTTTIVTVAKTPASVQQARTTGGPGYEGVEVSFKFKPSRPITDKAVRNFNQSTHTLRLTNSWYPGRRYIDKYHLSLGRIMPATLKIRTSGACTPMFFSFPEIDLADYFERAQ